MLQIPGSNHINGVHSYRLEVLRDRLQAVKKKEMTVIEWEQLDSRCQTLRYLVFLNEMFNSLFLNRSFYITADNVVNVQQFITDKLHFLAVWRDLVSNRCRADPSCANQFISPETYHNIKLLCAGFMGFTRYTCFK